jgi:hypothetical protein
MVAPQLATHRRHRRHRGAAMLLATRAGGGGGGSGTSHHRSNWGRHPLVLLGLCTVWALGAASPQLALQYSCTPSPCCYNRSGSHATDPSSRPGVMLGMDDGNPCSVALGGACFEIDRIRVDGRSPACPAPPPPPPAEARCVLPLAERWVVVLKTNGDATFGYDSPHWSSRSSTLNPSSDRRQPGNAKYPEYNTEPLDAVMGCVGDLSTCMPPHVFSQPIPNAASLFGGAYRAEGVNASAMLSAFKPVGQRDCAPQRAGFNTQCSDGNAARWGYCNNVPSQPCQSLHHHDADGAIGFGLRPGLNWALGSGDCCASGAGWTNFFTSDDNQQLAATAKQAWISVRIVQRGQPQVPAAFLLEGGLAVSSPNATEANQPAQVGVTVARLGTVGCQPGFVAAFGSRPAATCSTLEATLARTDSELRKGVCAVLSRADGVSLMDCGGVCVPRMSCPVFNMVGCAVSSTHS